MKVAVTTAADRAERVANALTAAGLEPVFLPCIDIQPASEPTLAAFRAEAETADLVVVTSARAVAVTWPSGMGGLAVAAIGKVSAAAARQAGGDVVSVGSAGSDHLISGLDDLGKLTVAYAHSAGANPTIAQRLAGLCATLIDVTTYTSSSIAPPADAVDAALFGSPSAVAGWVSSRSLDDLILASIGPMTSAALREHGVAPAIEPAVPNLAVVAARLADIEGARS